MPDELILVAGASGTLGSAIVRRLLGSGYRVRAVARDAARLEMLEAEGAEPFAADMLDSAAMERAFAGVSQVVSTANNILGKGRTSCNRIDEQMYRTSGAAAQAAGAGRWIHISARNLAADSAVDYFRVKHRVEGIVRDYQVPWVVIRPTAYIDIWMGVLFGDLERPKRVATVFGSGNSVVNYIAINDVASFVLAILRDRSLKNEIIDIGGPTETSFIDFASRVQRMRHLPEKRRHVPVPVLDLARHLVRPFNEVAARFASLGYWTTLGDRRFPEWRLTANRFGVEPISLDEFTEQRYTTSPR